MTMTNAQTFTHEQFIKAVTQVAVSRLTTDEKDKVNAIKLTYGAGPNGVRGITYYNRWNAGKEEVPFVAINAMCQESPVQLAGTTIHELGHVLAGYAAGHGKDWKNACEKLGLRRIKAAGTRYGFANFDPDVRDVIARMPNVTDGKPIDLYAALRGHGTMVIKPCGAGIGVRGGKSRGAGSGSRLRLFECECVPPIKVRVARDEFDCTCNTCNMLFYRK